MIEQLQISFAHVIIIRTLLEIECEWHTECKSLTAGLQLQSTSVPSQISSSSLGHQRQSHAAGITFSIYVYIGLPVETITCSSANLLNDFDSQYSNPRTFQDRQHAEKKSTCKSNSRVVLQLLMRCCVSEFPTLGAGHKCNTCNIGPPDPQTLSVS